MLDLEDLAEAAAVLDREGRILISNAVWNKRFRAANVLEQLAGSLERRDFRSQLQQLFQGLTRECAGDFAWSPGSRVQARCRELLRTPGQFLLRLDESTASVRHRHLQSLVDQLSEAVFLLDPSDGSTLYVNAALLRLMEVRERQIAFSPEQYGRVFRPELLPGLCRRLGLTGPLGLELDLKTTRGRGFAAQLQVLLLAGGPQPVLAGVIQDISEKRSQSRQLSAGAARLQAILESSPVAIVTFTLEGMVASWNPAAESIYGWSAEEVLLRVSPFGAELTHQLILDIMADGTTVSLQVARRCKGGEIVEVSLSVCPLLDEHGLLAGLLEVGENVTGRIRAERLASDARILEGREAERLTLAREIHDGPMQELLVIGFALAEAEHVAGRAENPHLAPIQASLLQVSVQLRSVLSRLRPACLDEVGLAASLQNIVDRTSQEFTQPPETRLHIEPVAGLTPSQELCLFRIVQEAYQNVLRHARARRVDISLCSVDSNLELRVTDDGRGFEAPGQLGDLGKQEHYGLLGMEERAALCGGTLRVLSEPEHGTRIQVTIPLEVGRD